MNHLITVKLASNVFYWFNTEHPAGVAQALETVVRDKYCGRFAAATKLRLHRKAVTLARIAWIVFLKVCQILSRFVALITLKQLRDLCDQFFHTIVYNIILLQHVSRHATLDVLNCGTGACL